MTTEFKKIKQGNITKYVLETATAGSTSAGAIATSDTSVGEVQARVPQKPRQGPLKPQTGGGSHRDRKKEQKKGKEKHRKPFAEQSIIENPALIGRAVAGAAKAASNIRPSPAPGAAGAVAGGIASAIGSGSNSDKPLGQTSDIVAPEGLEPDHEISMASNELKSIINDAKKLLMIIQRISEVEGLEAWQQSKITKATDYVSSVLRTLQGENLLQQGVEEDISRRDLLKGLAGLAGGLGVAGIANQLVKNQNLDSENVTTVNGERYRLGRPSLGAKLDGKTSAGRYKLVKDDKGNMVYIWRDRRISGKNIPSVVKKFIPADQVNEQGVAEGLGLYGPFTVTISTGERPQSRTKTKKFRREDDAILWAQDWLEDFPQYSFATAEVTDPEGNVVWTTDEQGVAEGIENNIDSMSIEELEQFVDRILPILQELSKQKSKTARDQFNQLKKQYDAALEKIYDVDSMNESTLQEKFKSKQGVAEGSESLETLRAKAKSISDEIDSIVQSGGRVGLNDPLSKKLKIIRNKIEQAKKDVQEGKKKGLYYYVNKRKKAGTSRPKGHPKAPSEQDWKDAAKTAKKESKDVYLNSLFEKLENRLK